MAKINGNDILFSPHVHIGGGVTPTGTITITSNGTHNVTNYASANVNVQDIAYTASTFPFSYVELMGGIIKITGFSQAGIASEKFDKVNVKIQSTYIIDGDTYTVVQIGNSAFSCIPEGTGASANYAVNGKIETIKLPNTVVSILPYAFAGYSKNTSLNSVTGMSAVTNIGNYAFLKTVLLQTVSLPAVTTLGEGAFEFSGIQNVTFGTQETKPLTAIPQFCFHFCDMLTTVNGTENVKTIGDCAFECCYQLNSLPLTVGTVESIGANAFTTCGFEFDFRTLTGCTFGSNATRYQTWGNKVESGYTACDLSKPLPIAAENDNFLKPFYFDGKSTTSGVEFTNNDDGTFTINGTASTNINKKIKDSFSLPAGKYIVCGTLGTGDVPRVGIYSASGNVELAIDNGFGAYLQLENDTNVVVRLLVAGGKTYNNIVVQPRLYSDWQVSYSQSIPATKYRHKNYTCTWHAFTAAYDIINDLPYMPIEVMVNVSKNNPEWIDDKVVPNRTYDNVDISEKIIVDDNFNLKYIYDQLLYGNPIVFTYHLHTGVDGMSSHAVCIYGVDSQGRFLISNSSSGRRGSVLQDKIGGITYKMKPYNLFNKIMKDSTLYSSYCWVVSQVGINDGYSAGVVPMYVRQPIISNNPYVYAGNRRQKEVGVDETRTITDEEFRQSFYVQNNPLYLRTYSEANSTFRYEIGIGETVTLTGIKLKTKIDNNYAAETIKVDIGGVEVLSANIANTADEQVFNFANPVQARDMAISLSTTKQFTGLGYMYEMYYVSLQTINYNIVYNPNCNDSVEVPQATVKKLNVTATLSSVTPVRSGYTFIGWNTKPNGNGTAYIAGSQYTENKGRTLYAQWQRSQ